MRRPLAFLVAIALSGVSSAMAEPQPRPAATRRAHAEKKWPMSADRFRAEMENRIGKLRERLERGIERRKMAAAKAQARRQEFLTDVGHLRTRVAAVTQDGVVTREEAQKVRELARQIGRGRRAS